MAGLQLSDDEQSERLKAWWKENGTSVIAGTVLGIAVIGGVNYWRIYKADRAESAAVLYDRLLAERQVDAGQKLIDEYEGTPYAGKAALLLARMAFENGDAEGAAEHLEWALAEAPDPADRRIARLRLARLAFGSGDTERAESLLAEMPVGGYVSEYHELRGDIAMARNDPETARGEYQAALEALPEQSGFADMLNRKLDAAIGASGSR